MRNVRDLEDTGGEGGEEEILAPEVTMRKEGKWTPVFLGSG